MTNLKELAILRNAEIISKLKNRIKFLGLHTSLIEVMNEKIINGTLEMCDEILKIINSFEIDKNHAPVPIN